MFPQLFDTVPDALVVVDGAGLIAMANRQAERLFGYPPAGLTGLPVEQLKQTYLACERQTQARLIPFGDAAECSIVADELLARGFGGDFNRLLAWWRTQRESAGCRSEAGSALADCENS